MVLLRQINEEGGKGLEDFEIIYKKYFKYVKHYAVSLCFDELLADEITQEAFIKAFNNYKNFKGDCKVESWICRIAHNIFVSMKRKPINENIDNCLFLVSDENLHSELEGKEQSKAILKALMTLSSPYKDVFYMRAVGEMQFDVIAEVFEKSESWARVTYYRAKKEILERLGDLNE